MEYLPTFRIDLSQVVGKYSIRGSIWDMLKSLRVYGYKNEQKNNMLWVKQVNIRTFISLRKPQFLGFLLNWFGPTNSENVCLVQGVSMCQYSIPSWEITYPTKRDKLRTLIFKKAKR